MKIPTYKFFNKTKTNLSTIIIKTNIIKYMFKSQMLFQRYQNREKSRAAAGNESARVVGKPF
jgi:DNA polymerase II large subunit